MLICLPIFNIFRYRKSTLFITNVTTGRLSSEERGENPNSPLFYNFEEQPLRHKQILSNYCKFGLLNSIGFFKYAIYLFGCAGVHKNESNPKFTWNYGIGNQFYLGPLSIDVLINFNRREHEAQFTTKILFSN